MDAAAVAISHRRAQEKAGTAELIALSQLSPEPACQKLATNPVGLAEDEAARRLKGYGLNLVTREQKPTILQEIWRRTNNPLNALLLTLATVSYFLGDLRAALVIVIMVFLSVITAFIQEHRSNQAAARLRAMVKTTASVRRGADGGHADFAEVPIETLVPGDVVRLSAGDMIPADLRLLEAKDLFVNQSPLTGEAMPTEKYAHACDGRLEIRSTCRISASWAPTSSAATPPASSCAPARRHFSVNWPMKSPASTCRPPSTKASTASPG